MAGGKHATKGKKEPSHKHDSVGLEVELRKIQKYEGGHSLSSIAHEQVSWYKL